MLRTHTCGELREKDVGKQVILCGWVHSIRSMSKMVFIDLRDRYGITQIIIPKENISNFPEISNIHNEYVIKVQGIVQKKPQENPKLETGKIEVLVNQIDVLNVSSELPISIIDNIVPSEETRLKYRYLDLRKPENLDNFLFRHKIVSAVREYLNSQNFIEVDTPMLCRSTPEGARDYLVPSRLHPGKFYSLPQSPQVYKQTLMVSGFDRYYQFAKCLRDEDLRGDRQPEFTQIDLEMSFVTMEDIQKLHEEYLSYTLEKVMGIKIKTPFPHLTYKEAMKQYNSDKPDLRKDKTNPKEFAFVWVDYFPLFEWNDEEQRLVSAHHPFTAPTKESLERLNQCVTKEDFLSLDSQAFDLVLNGVELGSGSIRIWNSDIQKKIFKILGLSDEEIKEKFGFLIDAFKFGTPPHGGLAVGLERLLMLLKGKDSIKEFIAFPKTKNGVALMENSPNFVSEKQLKDVHIKALKE
ncbi:MAG TPA: aspartate--tRNA ligase [archaeon]|jgi:aspartyl-tRNA synthetase|nr:aspartate--tRNA ligase [archaeon]HRT03186.1 aspartate--tRNA ligase [Candidatus Diapherotrites archaeon]